MQIKYKQIQSYQINATAFYQHQEYNQDQFKLNNQKQQSQIYDRKILIQIANYISISPINFATIIKYFRSLHHYEVQDGFSLVQQAIFDNIKDFSYQDMPQIFKYFYLVGEQKQSIQLLFKIVANFQTFNFVFPSKYFVQENYLLYPADQCSSMHLENIFAEKCKNIIKFQDCLSLLSHTKLLIQHFSLLLLTESLQVDSIEFIISRVFKNQFTQILNPFTVFNSQHSQFLNFSVIDSKILTLTLLYGIYKSYVNKNINCVTIEKNLQLLYQFSKQAMKEQIPILLKIFEILIAINPGLSINPDILNSVLILSKNLEEENQIIKSILVKANDIFSKDLFDISCYNKTLFVKCLYQYKIIEFQQNNLYFIQKDKNNDDCALYLYCKEIRIKMISNFDEDYLIVKLQNLLCYVSDNRAKLNSCRDLLLLDKDFYQSNENVENGIDQDYLCIQILIKDMVKLKFNKAAEFLQIKMFQFYDISHLLSTDIFQVSYDKLQIISYPFIVYFISQNFEQYVKKAQYLRFENISENLLAIYEILNKLIVDESQIILQQFIQVIIVDIELKSLLKQCMQIIVYNLANIVMLGNQNQQQNQIHILNQTHKFNHIEVINKLQSIKYIFSAAIQQNLIFFGEFQKISIHKIISIQPAKILSIPQILQLIDMKQITNIQLYISYYYDKPEYIYPYLFILVLQFRTNQIFETLFVQMKKYKNFQLLISPMVETAKQILEDKIFNGNISFIHQFSDDSLYKQLADLSQELIQIPDDQRNEYAQNKISSITIRNENLLSNQQLNIRQILSIKCLKSHAKVPILVKVDTLSSESSFIVKSNDSVLQDHIVMLILAHIKNLLKYQNIQAIIYGIIPLSKDTGFIDLVKDANSLDEIGNRSENFLVDYFQKYMTQIQQENFVKSFVFQAISQYLLQFKDRHNGNIMINIDGKVLDIDFGFLLEIAPGGVFSIEKAPFKFSRGYKQLIYDEQQFQNYFTSALYHIRYIIQDILILLKPTRGLIPCFNNIDTLKKIQDRLFLDISLIEFIKKSDNLVEDSKENIASVLYDKFQAKQNEINY